MNGGGAADWRGRVAADLYQFPKATGTSPSPGLRPPSPHFVGRGQGEGLSGISTEFLCEMVLNCPEALGWPRKGFGEARVQDAV